MSIRGNLREASLPDVIQLLSLGKKTGVLSVSDKKNFGDIFFRDGKIIYCSVVNREEKIGALLQNYGDISSKDLEKALEIQEESKNQKRIGDILIEMGFITKELLTKRIEKQITDTLFTFLTWEDGFFNFEPDIEPLSETITVELEADDILLEQARKIDEWSVIEKLLPTEKTVLLTTGIKNGAANLNPDEDYVYNLVNNRNSMKDIFERSTLGKYETGRAIYNLLKIGYIKTGEEKEIDVSASNQSKINEHYNLGLAFLLTEMYEEALREFRHMIQVDKTNTVAHFYSGMIYFRLNKYEYALRSFEELLKMGVSSVALFNNMALTLEKLAYMERAEEFYERAIRLDPENARVMANYGVLAYKQNLLSDAEERLRIALEIDPNMIFAKFFLALVFLENGLINEAIDEFLEVTKKEPAVWQVYYNIGQIYVNMEKFESAEHMLRKASDMTEDMAPSKALVELHFLEKNFDAAESILEHIISVKKNDFDSYYKLGNIKYRKADREGAVRYWERALEIQPDNQILKKTLDTVKNG